MKANKLLLAAIATIGLAGVAVIGCGGDDNDNKCGDGGCVDAGPQPFGISNSGCYTVESLTNLTDGCEFGADLTAGNSFPATYNRSTATLSLGREVGSPGQPSLGSGTITYNAGTMARNNTVMEPGSTCTWNEVVAGNLTVTAIDTFTITYTDTQRSFSAGCKDPPPPTGGSCTSTWTWVVKKTGESCADGGV